MRGRVRGRRGEQELRAWAARMAALREQQAELESLESPSEGWRAFNLSNVARGWVEQRRAATEELTAAEGSGG